MDPSRVIVSTGSEGVTELRSFIIKNVEELPIDHPDCKDVLDSVSTVIENSQRKIELVNRINLIDSLDILQAIKGVILDEGSDSESESESETEEEIDHTPCKAILKYGKNKGKPCGSTGLCCHKRNAK